MVAKTKYVGALAAAAGALVAVGLLMLLLVGGPQSAGATPVSKPAAPQMNEQETLDTYEKLPLSFIPNEGQREEAVRYYAQGAGYGFFFTKEGAMLSFANGEGGSGHALALEFLGADPDATLKAQKRLAGEVNYLVGDDPAKWQSGLPTYGELLYGGLWPGIDMAVRGEGGNLKYEFHLKPGASVEDVRLGYRGAEGLKVGDGGELLVRTSVGVLKDAAPVSYQRIGGERVPVKSRYKLTGDGGYGFEVGAYDPRYPLVIDPGLDYSTFLGGKHYDQGMDIAVDQKGRAFVTGTTQSGDYPTTPGAFDTSLEGAGTIEDAQDVFVTKLNASGSKLAYSTFLGGRGWDQGMGIAVDQKGRAFVTGETFVSDDYPTTPGAFDRTLDGGFDAFLTKLNASGSKLAYSTFLGGRGADKGMDIAVDQKGRAFVTGTTQSDDYPTTPGAFDTSSGNSNDAFVTKLNASGSKLTYSTFLGGTFDDYGNGIAVDGSGRAYVTGTTGSAEYPTTPGAFDTSYNGSGDAFVTKLNASGSKLTYSTFLGGGNYDDGEGIAVDGKGRVFVTGYTYSVDYPTTRGAFDRTFNGKINVRDAFVTKLNASGSALDYSTFLGGRHFEESYGIAVDESGRAYVTGFSASENYPTTPGAFDRTFNGGADAYVTKLNASGSKLAYSTFLGGGGEGQGIAVRDGRAYVTGGTSSAEYPTTPGAFDTSYNGSGDAFVTKLPTG